MSSVTPAIDVAAAPAATSAKPEHSHMPPLDGVRGTAILLVLIGHACESISAELGFTTPLLRLGGLGWAGVDLFFVLSGFLITGILYESKSRASYFKTFYVRRALRIFPLYYLTLIIVLAMSRLAPSLGVWGFENPAWTWVYLTNFFIAAKGADAFGVVDHFWSLAVEEHYYLIWPTIVFFLPRRGLMMAAGAAMVIGLMLRLSQVDASGVMSMAGYMATPMRMDSLAAGSLIALIARGPGGIRRLAKPAAVVAPIAVAVFVALVVWRRATSPHDAVLGTFGITTLWIAFAAALVLSLTWKPAMSAMSTAPMRWLGKYSYGLYVWHPIVIICLVHTDWARAMRGGNSVPEVVGAVSLGLALSVAAALLSWNLWEKQFLKLKGQFA